MTGVLIKEGETPGRAHTEGRPGEPQQEDCRLQAEQRGLRGNRACQHLDLRPGPPELGGATFSLTHSVCGTLLRQPEQMNAGVPGSRPRRGRTAAAEALALSGQDLWLSSRKIPSTLYTSAAKLTGCLMKECN